MRPDGRGLRRRFLAHSRSIDRDDRIGDQRLEGPPYLTAHVLGARPVRRGCRHDHVKAEGALAISDIGAKSLDNALPHQAVEYGVDGAPGSQVRLLRKIKLLDVTPLASGGSMGPALREPGLGHRDVRLGQGMADRQNAVIDEGSRRPQSAGQPGRVLGRHDRIARAG